MYCDSCRGAVLRQMEMKMDRIGTNFKDEQAAQNWAKGKAKFNSKIEKIDGGWRVTWDVKSLKNVK